MGWLDHSTNNIILDAVLTDYGRQVLSNANSAFNIASYALGDDEVDYRNVKKYGRTVGKEKIEKLTPIFEALTNQNIALKYKLIGRESSSETTVLASTYLPLLKLVSPSDTVSLVAGQNRQATVTVNLTYANTQIIPVELQQPLYYIKVSDRFFTISNATGGASLSAASTAQGTILAGDPNRTATYVYTVPPNQNTLTFTVTAKNLDATTMSVYGKKVDNSATRIITSYISIRGDRLGTVLDIPVTYKSAVNS